MWFCLLSIDMWFCTLSIDMWFSTSASKSSYYESAIFSLGFKSFERKKKEFGKSVGVLSKKLMDLHPKLSDASRWNEKLKHKKKSV